ncbi:MAG: hypothetical protein KIT14_13970 [bacterium]|nr:hypothetical protein [bacterium]
MAECQSIPALEAAFIGAAGGLVVALLNALLTQRREHRQWLRDQRVEVYAQLHRVGRELEDAGNQLHGVVTGPHGAYDWAVGPATDRLRTSTHDLLQMYERLELVGSQRLVDVASPLWELAFHLKDDLTHGPFDRTAFADRWNSPDEGGESLASPA